LRKTEGKYLRCDEGVILEQVFIVSIRFILRMNLDPMISVVERNRYLSMPDRIILLSIGEMLRPRYSLDEIRD